MKTIHDIRQEKIVTQVLCTCAFIRSHDASYEHNLEQVNRLFEILDNISRYANTIQERMEKQQCTQY